MRKSTAHLAAALAVWAVAAVFVTRMSPVALPDSNQEEVHRRLDYLYPQCSLRQSIRSELSERLQVPATNAVSPFFR